MDEAKSAKLDLRFDENSFAQINDLFERDRSQLKKVLKKLEELRRTGTFQSSVKMLRHKAGDFWSCDVDKKNRIVFVICEDNNRGDYLYIFSCHGHYDDK
ncbi:type II toxin-antitoxin system YoeB family toxin (plasmid) [Entomospira entomophila]|uniref:Type II toxin-antitoxin system YoeB family toxin n=1 Tax=Entomospira entomophila TaxID=2719988 RepID=A0A968GEH1_9SPIO|nr:type II toxin-antitoxin system YoeB family toxin [Entomospira entomophilus]NIZ41559.1 type II toxin-antitoxin system YoeB family toxin [Entomospira entomophilus]WDI36463.1 type II toxin-antitoxin system YoeB family toxin [Entomospira entomophilus]